MQKSNKDKIMRSYPYCYVPFHITTFHFIYLLILDIQVYATL